MPSGAEQLGAASARAIIDAARGLTWGGRKLLGPPFRTLDPLRQNLRRIEHGAAFMLLPGIAALSLLGPGAVADDLAALALDPRAHVPITAAFGVGVLLFIIGLARFGYGWRRAAGVRDGLLLAGGMIRLALGVGLLWWRLPPDVIAPSFTPWAALALFMAGLCLAVTGAARCARLMRFAGRALPEVEEDIAAKEFSWDE